MEHHERPHLTSAGDMDFPLAQSSIDNAIGETDLLNDMFGFRVRCQQSRSVSTRACTHHQDIYLLDVSPNLRMSIAPR